MAFGRKSGPVRAYRYGLRDPISGREAAIESMRARVALWNQLVPLEAERRERREALLAPFITPEMTAEERKVARRSACHLPEVSEALNVLDTARDEAARALRLQSAAFHWQKDDLRGRWDAACKKVDPPGYQPFRPYEGICALRWQTGLPVATALDGTDLNLQLCPAPASETADPNSYRSQRRTHVLCRFRVASDNGRPVWLEAPVILHRPLPPDGVIRSAVIKWRRVALHVRWSLSLVVRVAPPLPSERSGQAALDLGWRLTERGLRVGYLRDERGHVEQALLDLGWVQQYERVESIQQHRDMLRNEVLALLQTFRVVCAAAASSPGREWFIDETRFLHLWKASKRPARLAIAWRAHRFADDEEMFADLEAWRDRDKHLLNFEANLRDQLLARRRDLYRNFAVSVARRYGVIHIERFDLRDVARVKPDESGEPGAGKELARLARHQRQMAAPSELRNTLLHTCGREGSRVEKWSAKNTTMTCPACGRIETPTEFDKAHELVHACVGCGAEYDQDDRACQNLLAFANS